MDETPFWRAKTLAQMTPQEWESLCDGCGRCCLHKLRDDDTDEILFTSVACHLLDRQSCRCGDYERRQARVPDCVALRPDEVAAIDWLPPSCAYRLVQEGRDLAWWHPLVSGDPDSVHAGGASVRGRVISERAAGPLEDYVAGWPGRMPRRRAPATVVRRTGAAPAPETAVPAPATPQPRTPPPATLPLPAPAAPAPAHVLAAPPPAAAVGPMVSSGSTPSARKRAPGARRRALAPPAALVPGPRTTVAAVVAFPRPVPQTGTPGTLPPVATAPVPVGASRSRRAARAEADGARAAKAQASGAQAGAPAQLMPGPGGPPNEETGT